MEKKLSSDHEERLEAMIESINLVARLVEDKENSVTIDRKLDEVNSRWKLEETSLPSLVSSIHSLKSKLNLLCDDVENVVKENNTLKELLNKNIEEKTKLEGGVKILINLNRNMKKKILRLSSKKRDSGYLLRKVKELLSNVQEKEKLEEERTVEMKLRIHERILVTNKNGGTTEDEESVVSTLSSISTISSIIIEDSIPTVRLNEKISTVDSQCQDSITVNQHLQLDSRESFAPSGKRSHVWDHLRNIGGQSKIYCISFSTIEDIGLQFVWVSMESKKEKKLKGHGLIDKMLKDTEAELTEKSSFPKKPDGTYLVCGFHGFDEGLHMRPAIGARLIAIENHSLEQCSLAPTEMHAIINGLPQGNSIIFKLRNDSLNKLQTNTLNNASPFSTNMTMNSYLCGFSKEAHSQPGCEINILDTKTIQRKKKNNQSRIAGIRRIKIF